MSGYSDFFGFGFKAPAKRSQHLSTQHIPTSLAQHLQAPAKRSQTYRNIVGRNMLRAFGHPVATRCGMLGIENRTSSHAWTHYCCNDLAKRPQHHATFLKVAWKFGHFQISANNTNLSQLVATGLPNTCDMLRPLMLWYVVLNVVIVWPGGA